MSNREQDVRVGIEVMGWHKEHWDWKFTLPHFHRDISASYQMEERIKDKGLIEEYCYQLRRITNLHWEEGIREPQTWQLLHASPADRCRAALRAVEAVKKRS